MNKINYTGKWALDISNMDKAEWDQLVSILKSKGVKVYVKEYNPDVPYLYPSIVQDDLVRGSNPNCRTVVTLLQMLNLLEAPIKSPSQLKIEELQQTIKLANDQIEALKEL
tara:strand:- start:447 stop:779 length:333 start_codon:yes stop_codon:yes gene_type:complete